MVIIKSTGHTFRVDISTRFELVSRRLGTGSCSASYYPYRELKHTWRREGGSFVFRVSDYLRDSPEPVLDSLAYYLICRAFRRRCPDQGSGPYLSYSRSSHLWCRVRDEYLARARNLTLVPRGEHRDLSTVFDYVNSSYFGCRIPNPTLAWVKESPRERLGFYFAPLNLLAVNAEFDSERVPRYALEFVMYHELLHHLDAVDGRPRRRIHHTRSFREQERLFSSSAEAETWLRRIAAKGVARPR